MFCRKDVDLPKILTGIRTRDCKRNPQVHVEYTEVASIPALFGNVSVRTTTRFRGKNARERAAAFIEDQSADPKNVV